MKKTLLLLAAIFMAQATFSQQVKIERLNNEQPLITAQMFDEAGALEVDGHNINSPMVIALPKWLAKKDRVSPKAKYYMYFAHHAGTYIRMAWAERIEGPWTLHNVGQNVDLDKKGVLSMYSKTEDGYCDTMRISNRVITTGHIASPFVVLDNENKKFILYFHGGRTCIDDSQKRLSPQRTFVATSNDGLDFAQDPFQPAVLGQSYFLPFEHKGRWYAFSNTGDFHIAPTEGSLWVAPDDMFPGDYLWESGRCILDELFEKHSKKHNIVVDPIMMPRHVGIRIEGDKMYLLCSAKSDSPERLYFTTFDISNDDSNKWSATDLEIVMTAKTDWEGGNLEPQLSENGKANTMLNDVRDPFIFEDTDGKLYLFYVGGGERAIGVASIEFVE